MHTGADQQSTETRRTAFDSPRAHLAVTVPCRVPERIEFRFAVLTYKVVHGLAPGYLGPFTRVADLPSRQWMRSIGNNRLVVPISRLSTVGSRALPVAGRGHGMTSQKTRHQQNRWPRFVASSRHICSGSLFLTTCWTSADCLRWT